MAGNRTYDVKINQLGKRTFMSLHARARRGWGKRLYWTVLQDNERIADGLARLYEEYDKQRSVDLGG